MLHQKMILMLIVLGVFAGLTCAQASHPHPNQMGQVSVLADQLVNESGQLFSASTHVSDVNDPIITLGRMEYQRLHRAALSFAQLVRESRTAPGRTREAYLALQTQWARTVRFDDVYRPYRTPRAFIRKVRYVMTQLHDYYPGGVDTPLRQGYMSVRKYPDLLGLTKDLDVAAARLKSEAGSYARLLRARDSLTKDEKIFMQGLDDIDRLRSETEKFFTVLDRYPGRTVLLNGLYEDLWGHWSAVVDRSTYLPGQMRIEAVAFGRSLERMGPYMATFNERGLNPYLLPAPQMIAQEHDYYHKWPSELGKRLYKDR